jgi:putative flippase GtrA
MLPSFSLKIKGFLIRLSVSVCIAHLFASAGQPFTPFEVMKLNGYVPALLIGILASVLTSYLLTSISSFLNEKYPWKEFRLLRPCLQVFGGIIVPFLFIFLLMTLYFAAAGIRVETTRWIDHCIGYIIVALIFGNIGSEALERRMAKPIVESINLTPYVDKKPLSPLLFKGEPYTDLIYIVAINRVNYAMFKDGIMHSIKLTLENIMKLLPSDTHLRVNRHQIVNLAFIAKARYNGTDRNRIRIYLIGHENVQILTSENYTTKAMKAILKPYLAMDN